MEKFFKFVKNELQHFHATLLHIAEHERKEKRYYVFFLISLLGVFVVLRGVAATLLLNYNNYQVVVVVGFIVPVVVLMNMVRKQSLRLRQKHEDIEPVEVPNLFAIIPFKKRIKNVLVSTILLLSGMVLYGFGNGIIQGRWFRLPKGIGLFHGIDGSCKQTNWQILKDFYYIGLSVPLQVLYFFVFELFMLYAINTLLNGRSRSMIEVLLFLTAISTFAAVHLTFGMESCIFSGCTLGVAHAYNILYKKDVLSSLIVHTIFGTYAILIGWVDPNHWH